MIKIIFHPVTITVCICLLIISCGKHIYVLNGNEINKYAAAAKEPGRGVFVVYDNGDTIKGAALKTRHNILNGKKEWEIDGKAIPLEHIVAYQDEYGYRMGEYSRVLRGKMNLYFHQVDNSRLVTHYNSNTKSFKSDVTGHVETSFFIGKGDVINPTDYTSVYQALQNCPPALKQLEIEFGGSVYKRNPRYPINDYRALIRIVKNFNDNNCN